ncbi:MAG TPA: MBL fold metallo-hydrolase [Thermomicrobiaceae bacterium]|nr:MBL fold metallo-hydrolase [Thermomicrobiaceae bacterium]
MRLTVLGGAAASPNPGQGCAGYLVQSGDEQLVLDCGPDTLAVLRQHADFRQVRAVLISHLHSDHTLDLVPYRYGLKYAPGPRGARVPLWMPPGGRAFLNDLGSVFALGSERDMAFFDEVFDVAEYDPGQPLHLGRFTITFHETQHFIPAWAMRLVADSQTLVYGADTGPYPPLAAFAAHADLVVLEATMPESQQQSGERAGHLSASQAGRLAAEARARRLLLTHYWAELGPEHLVEVAAAKFPGEVLLARPGLMVEL